MRWTLLAALMLLASCQRETARVDAADYDSFWLWAGVKPQPVLERAKTIYILEGEIRDAARPRLTSLRPGTPQVGHAEIWLVYRVETLGLGPEIVPRMRADLARWRGAGNRVTGIQIDFDAATSGLADYAIFLKKMRESLPADCKLSITGLLDWSSSAEESDGLNMLAGIVDEVGLQVYQGRHTIPGYQDYMKNLDRLMLPFRIGLVQGGEWDAPDALKANPYYRGNVVFLVNR